MFSGFEQRLDKVKKKYTTRAIRDEENVAAAATDARRLEDRREMREANREMRKRKYKKERATALKLPSDMVCPTCSEHKPSARQWARVTLMSVEIRVCMSCARRIKHAMPDNR